MNLVRLLKFTIEVDSPPGEVMERLRSAVEPGWFVFRSDRPLGGRVSESGFSVGRAIVYRRAFVPWMRGTVEPFGGGSRVHVTMTIHPVGEVFAAVSLPAVAVGLLAGLATEPTAADPIPTGMFFVVVVMTAIGYLSDVGPSRRALEAVVTGAAD